MSQPLLEIKGLHTYFYVKAGTVKAVDGVDLIVNAGRKVGVVGESGSGKTTLALSIMRMVRPPGTTEGKILLDGVDLLKLNDEEMRRMRLSQISYMPQGAMNSLNPVAKIKAQIVDGMLDHNYQFASKDDQQKIVTQLLEVAELPARVADMFPHELSGGMKQRVCLAIAIALRPKLLIADEPTSALDVVIQREVMDTITGLVQDLNLSMILIGHDMGLMAQTVDQLAVMYAGHMMEVGEVRDIFAEPYHPYTRALIRSLPRLGKRGLFEGVPGIPPSVINPAPGCPFCARCPELVGEICTRQAPPLVELKPGRWTACHIYDGAVL
jgi:oligopeptide/dipeptide ABC transporter ATP-binding protein